LIIYIRNFFFFFFSNTVYFRRTVFFFKKVFYFIKIDLSTIISRISFLTVFFFSLFYFLIFRNYFGLIPYIFSFTSHLRLIISISFIFWVSIFTVRLIYNFNNFIIHLVPEGRSFLLIPLIVLIESLSNIIRPFTLSIRLGANIIAGHLLIVLVNDFCKRLPLEKIFLCGFGRVALSILELIVIIIQAYVFIILIRLYYSE